MVKATSIQSVQLTRMGVLFSVMAWVIKKMQLKRLTGMLKRYKMRMIRRRQEKDLILGLSIVDSKRFPLR